MTLDLANSPSPADLWEMDRAFAASPTNFGSFERGAARPRGVRLLSVDAEGGSIWMRSAAWCTNVGLGRKDMARAIADQVERLAFANSFVDVTNEPRRLSAKRRRWLPVI